MVAAWLGADLIKAADAAAQRAEGERPETWMAPIEGRVALAGGDARRDLARDLPMLFPGVAKAQGALPVTTFQLDELKLLVRQHYLARLAPDQRAAFWSIGEAARERWRALGILGPSGDGPGIDDAIDDAVVAARVAEILDTGASYRQMRRLAAERPQTRLQELARGVAQAHAGRAVDWLADRHAHELGDDAAADQLARFQGLLSRFLGGQIQGVGSERQLASHLRQTLGGGSFDRDWQRLAVTETRFAFNYATLVHYAETGREQVYYRVQPDACLHCQRLLLNDDGTPRLFATDELLENIAITGGTNQGRKASLIGQEGGWLVTAIIHPWCRCAPQPYLPGLPPVPVGDLRRG